MTLRKLFLFILLIFPLQQAVTMPQQYYSFDHIGGVTQKLCVRSIVQSADGTMWLAAESGLYSYDGSHLAARAVDKSCMDGKEPGSFNCLLDDGDSLLIGCNRGLLSFNLLTYRFRFLPYARGEMVRSIVKTEGIIWVATAHAIYRNGSKLEPSPDQIVSMYSYRKSLYIGTSDAVYRYSIDKQQLEKMKSDIAYVSCFLLDKSTDLLWIGTAQNVTACELGTMKQVCSLSVPVAKSLCVDNRGNVLAGTDNGLYVIGKNHQAKAVLHDARRENSLAGDAVWCVFQDRDHNVWTGTNSGVSVVSGDGLITVYPLPAITGEGMGNQFFCTYIDSQGRYWLGGSNGLLCINRRENEELTYKWYRMNDARYPIPHNRIRAILETTDGDILIGGDMGVLILDESTLQFQRYWIKEDACNWVYGIREAGNKELAITTFDATYLAVPDRNSRIFKVKKISRKEDLSKGGNTQKVLLEKYGLTKNFLSAFYDSVTGIVLLGGTDRFAVLDTKRLNATHRKSQLVVTDILIDSRLYTDRMDLQKNRAIIQPGDKMVEVMFSDFNYSAELSRDYFYQIDDGEWMPIHSGNQSIILTNLHPGNHTLSIRPAGVVNAATVLNLKVLAPWYATGMARFIYLLVCMCLLYGIYQIFKQGKRIKQARLEYQELALRTRQKEKELLGDNEYLSAQLRLRLLAKAGEDEELSQDEKFLLKITRIVEENMSNTELNVNTLCELSGFTSKQLYRKVKTTTGMTVVAYIRDQRMKKAASLLSKGTFTVSEVMYMVGFSNASYFTRCFTEEYHTAPSEYKATLPKEL